MGERVSLYTYVPLTIPHCFGFVIAHSRLYNFTVILLELRARHRQSPCVMRCIVLSSVGTTCPLHKIHCTRGSAKRSGSEPNCSLHWLSEEGWVGCVTHTSSAPLPGGWSEVLCWASWPGSGMHTGRRSGGRRHNAIQQKVRKRHGRKSASSVRASRLDTNFTRRIGYFH